SGEEADIQVVQPMLLVSGRYLNPLDVAESRKIAVVGTQVVSELFANAEEPIGAHLEIQGVQFMIVGVVRSQATGDESDRQNKQVMLPLTTFQRAFQRGNKIGWFAMTALPDVSSAELEKEVRALLMRRHLIAPEDDQALGSFNGEKEFRKIEALFT